ncbi:class I SAM-dependent RNA methyltransferase [Nocardioides solisilvae]|uniref:class I SAM-dependent RNA methyltransferase n=1 Tax=Nocardioides solisilvae TaxID=1542435 RepID=UPI000D74177C|nr:methyltransferase domain-containing protein [Nocardioides solisilvae]
MSRPVRERRSRGRSRVGERFEAEVGPVAHGGHCVVRVAADPAEPERTRVVFTRHAVPGERVVVEVTEGSDGDRFWRGDAVEVLRASEHRVAPPCPYAGPGLCGGCDFQHVALGHQRDLKASVVREQLVRVARMDAADPLVAGLVVEAVPGDLDGLRWRTRSRFVPLPGGGRGMRQHRSHEVVEIDDCLIESLEPQVGHAVHGREFSVASGGFWQVHPGAPEALVDAVLAMLDPQPGESVLDLYAGVGLFARFLAERVGPGARVVAVEGDREAATQARANLSGAAKVRVSAGGVAEVLEHEYDEPFDLVVLDPPRTGAKREVVAQVADRAPRAVAYVACDPSALARDLALFAEAGYRTTALRAFDLFPMTHHVECVALLERSAPGDVAGTGGRPH